jgi:hypothetical protein
MSGAHQQIISTYGKHPTPASCGFILLSGSIRDDLCYKNAMLVKMPNE